jgi:hypothetical protein
MGLAPNFASHQPVIQRLVPSGNHELAQVTEVGQGRFGVSIQAWTSFGKGGAVLG